jgi:hypothetical protein
MKKQKGILLRRIVNDLYFKRGLPKKRSRKA